MTDVRLAGTADLPPVGSHVFLAGVAGAGMRALATVFLARGYRVTGADRDEAAARSLADAGVSIVSESEASAASRADLFVHSSALPATHPLLLAARDAGVPILKRSRALGALVNDHRLVAVAGTHGKTTVTTMLAIAVEAAGLDPLALVGGRVASWDGNARIGEGEIAIVEADEYDRSFLELRPELAIVTSREAEHLDVYGDEAGMNRAYAEFAARAADLLVCADDPGASRLGTEVGDVAEIRSYGFAPDSTYRLEVVDAGRRGQSCRLDGPDGSLPFVVGAPGAHNAQNAAGALAAALWLGAPPREIGTALEDFRGAERRLQVLHESSDLVVIDDYAHHPTEVRAGIEALRSAWPGRHLIVVFQPHLFSRTRDQAAGFAEALSRADRGLVLPIYPSREAPIAGVTRDLILEASHRELQPFEADDVPDLLERSVPKIVAFMGAGDVTNLARGFARAAAGRPDALGG